MAEPKTAALPQTIGFRLGVEKDKSFIPAVGCIGNLTGARTRNSFVVVEVHNDTTFDIILPMIRQDAEKKLSFGPDKYGLEVKGTSCICAVCYCCNDCCNCGSHEKTIAAAEAIFTQVDPSTAYQVFRLVVGDTRGLHVEFTETLTPNLPTTGEYLEKL